MDDQEEVSALNGRWRYPLKTGEEAEGTALVSLLEAYEYAQEFCRNPWDFAVEIEVLRQAGVTKSQLRWMICKGLVEHNCESSRQGAETRTFQQHCGLTLCKKSCFVLTEAGVGYARQVCAVAAAGQSARAPSGRVSPEGGASVALESHLGPVLQSARPHWDGTRQELWLGKYLVKRFKLPAPNQEVILAAFEEESWPVRIQDPLPPQRNQDPKRRLHDTINGLNRHQRNPLMRFCGDGSGRGVRWERVSLLTENGESPDLH